MITFECKMKMEYIILKQCETRLVKYHRSTYIIEHGTGSHLQGTRLPAAAYHKHPRPHQGPVEPAVEPRWPAAEGGRTKAVQKHCALSEQE